jgi:adenosylcobinamide-GDP ribazoletransferase
MAARDILNDLASGFGLLTRIPVPAVPPRSLSAWTWPVVGLVTGLASALCAMSLYPILPALPVALLALSLPVILTGGLHEDGLADCADGFWGGRDRARRLEIMKDSHIGSYGVIALVLVLGLKASALAALIADEAWPLIILAAVLSRAPMAAIMRALPNARGSGLSHLTGQPSAPAVAIGAGIALFGAILCGATGLTMAGMVAVGALATAAIARAKIGGQTGDVLGATQSLCETAALLTALALQ